MRKRQATEQHYFPYHRNEKYPRNLNVDFRKIDVSCARV